MTISLTWNVPVDSYRISAGFLSSEVEGLAPLNSQYHEVGMPEERSVKKGKVYVYDRKEDKNLLLTNNQSSIDNNQIKWYFDSRHFVVEEEKKISIVDYDNTNKQTIYSGPFESSFLNTTNDGKIVVLINLNSQMNELPDLYLVGIR